MNKDLELQHCKKIKMKSDSLYDIRFKMNSVASQLYDNWQGEEASAIINKLEDNIRKLEIVRNEMDEFAHDYMNEVYKNETL